MRSTLIADSLEFRNNARAAADEMMTYYSPSSGLWYDGKKPLWWNSANMLTAMIDLFRVDSSVKDKYGYIVETTYTKAPGANPHSNKNPTFLNDFYDDEGWWALTWVNAYDLTGTPEYLTTAKEIWTDMRKGATTPFLGAIWWDKKQTYIASIANELFLAVSAALAIREQSKASRDLYISSTIASLAFFRQTNLLSTATHLVIDGISPSSTLNHSKFTYNQGVILGGLLDLSLATSDPSYTDLAIKISTAASSSPTSPFITAGILHEANNCEKKNECGNDGDQFKGVFVRNLRRVLVETTERACADQRTAWKGFLTRNAVSVWERDRCDTAVIGPDWAGPAVGKGSAPAQCSGLEVLSAAAVAVTVDGDIELG